MSTIENGGMSLRDFIAAANPATISELLDWRRGDETIEQPDPREIGEAIDAAIEIIERVAALPASITLNQAPAELRKYWPIAAQCYAKGWNDCMKAVKEESK